MAGRVKRIVGYVTGVEERECVFMGRVYTSFRRSTGVYCRKGTGLGGGVNLQRKKREESACPEMESLKGERGKVQSTVPFSLKAEEAREKERVE